MTMNVAGAHLGAKRASVAAEGKASAYSNHSHEEHNKALIHEAAEAHNKQTQGGQRGSSVSESAWQRICEAQGISIEPSIEPEKKPFVDETWFDLSIGVAIMLNALVMGFETDYKKGEDKDHVAWLVLENVFCIVWVFEMLAKFYYKHLEYFFKRSSEGRFKLNGWNCMDFFLVGLSIMDAWILPGMGQDVGSMGTLKMLRILRILRLLRLVRLMRMLRELWIIVSSMADSIRSLSWLFLLLSLVIYVVAILMTLLVGHECDNAFKDSSWQHERDCQRMFGDVPSSMYTMFQILTLESWSMAVIRPVFEVQPAFFLIILFFLFLTTFGLLNNIIGVIVETTTQAAKENDHLQKARAEKKVREDLMTLREIFDEADENHSGVLDLKEFKAVLDKSEVKDILQGSFGLPAVDPELLFNLLDEDKGGTIESEEFFSGVLKLRQGVSGMDLQQLVSTMKVINKKSRDRVGDIDELSALIASIEAESKQFNASIASAHRSYKEAAMTAKESPGAAVSEGKSPEKSLRGLQQDIQTQPELFNSLRCAASRLTDHSERIEELVASFPEG